MILGKEIPTTIGEIFISMPPYNPTPTNMETREGESTCIPIVTQPESTDDAFNPDHNDSVSVAQPSLQGMGAHDDDRLPGELPVQRTVIHDTDDLDDDEGKNIQEDVNTQLHREANDHADDEDFDSVIDHQWNDGVLLLKLKWKSGETSEVPFSLAHIDFPVEI